MPAKTKQPRVVGVSCGIGSLLIGARSAGFDVVGNIEKRPFFHTGTFEANFPGAFMERTIADLGVPTMRQLIGIDLAVGHPSCGKYSTLNVRNKALKNDPGDIPIFIAGAREIQPRVFAIDNHAKSLEHAFPIDQWASELGDYELWPEWVSNWYYGNSQKSRRRMFMIGAQRGEGFVFWPGEQDGWSVRTMRQAIGDLHATRDRVDIDHVHFKPTDHLAGWRDYHLELSTRNHRVTLAQMRTWLKARHDRGCLPYTNLKGETKRRIGYRFANLDGPSPTMGGGQTSPMNHWRRDTMSPLTPRERARIQGIPDDFVFMPRTFTRDPYAKVYLDVYKQISKFMPVEFATYLGEQVFAHFTRRRFVSTGVRLEKPNPLVTAAKKRWCELRGYEQQTQACAACWIDDCEIMKKRGVTVKQRDAARVRRAA